MRSDLLQTQRQRNAVTKDDRESYAHHREQVMLLIEATASEQAGPENPACDAVTLLGAGNCLDVDLPRLGELFRVIHLVDIDESALADAVHAVLGLAAPFRRHAPVDIAAPLLSLTSQDFQTTVEHKQSTTNTLQALAANDTGLEIEPNSCDAVVSLCLLTQLTGSLAEVISEDHPLFAQAVRAIRIGHLRRMLKLLRPGGVAVLVTDLVSSDTAPELVDTPQEELGPLMKQLVNDRNFFTGVNPALVLSDLQMLERLPNGPDTAQVFDPWRWHMGPRVLAVYGIRFQTKRPVETLDEEAANQSSPSRPGNEPYSDTE